MKLIVCIASRGLVHSRTIESVLRNVRSLEMPELFEWEIVFTNDLPIPDAQNDLVRQALRKKADALWFVEEDMLIPDGTLKKMFKSNAPVVAVDYPVGPKNYSTICKIDGKIEWCALGCTLLDKKVFRMIEDPWFETNKTIKIIDPLKMKYIIDHDTPSKYGGQDVMFGIKLKARGIEIQEVEGVVAGHIKMIKKGARESNNGVHEVEIRETIDMYQNY